METFNQLLESFPHFGAPRYQVTLDRGKASSTDRCNNGREACSIGCSPCSEKSACDSQVLGVLLFLYYLSNYFDSDVLSRMRRLFSVSFPQLAAYIAGVSSGTVYITDLPSYSSLATCAQFAVSYPVMSLGNEGGGCPYAPLGLLSFACVKDQNWQALTSTIVSQAKEQCGTTADSDVSSALGVFAYNCSAGKGLVTPAGVTASVTTNPYGGGLTGLSGIFPSSTGNSPGCSDPLGCIGLPTSTHIPLGAIIGGAAGDVLFIIFTLVAGWRYRRKRLPRQPPLPMQQYTPHVNNNINEAGKAELAGTSMFSANTLSTNPSMSKPTPSMSIFSPVSPIEEKENPLAAGRLEMEAQYAVLPGRTEMEAQNRSEVPTRQNPLELHPEHARYEVQGSNQHPIEIPSLSANMSSGPYYELEGPYR